MEVKEVKNIINLSENGRSTLAHAMLEDESVRLASAAASKAYVERVENEKDEMPFWMWCTLYFCLGMLFTMTIPALSNILWTIINGGQ